MASTVKHLRSSTANKRPTASGLADGQLGINTASGTPGVFFKDSAGTVVKVGPAHVGASAPNATPAGSAGNSLGELWVNNSTTINGLNYYTGSAFVNLTPSGTTTVAGLVELATNAETQTGTDTIRAVTPSGLQSKISDSTSTTSSTTIASATAVKTAYDLADAALPKTGGRITGNLEIGPTGSLVFEGSSDDGFETTFAVVNPTADRTITFPNVTGNVVTTGDSGTVTSTMIANSTIVDADISASAAIAPSKLGSGALPSGVTVASANILDGTITNADINASAAIADTKLATISTAGKVSGTAITSGDIDTSGKLNITSEFPAIRLAESDGTATHSQTLLARNDDQFLLQTRDSTGAVVSSDYLIPTNANGATDHIWRIANTERARIDSSGRLLVGNTIARTNIAGATPGVQIEGINDNSRRVAIISSTSANQSGLLAFASQRSGAIGGNTIVGNNANLGAIQFTGSDGANFIPAASIQGETDGTPNTDDMPGRLVFSTTSDGNSSPTERMRIDSDGNVKIDGKVGIGDSTSSATQLVVGGNIPDDGQAFAVGVNIAAKASTSTDAIYGFISDIGPTTSSANTVTYINRYYARQLNSFGSATVTNQYGFIAAFNLTGATNNYGFYSELADATGCWNFYAAGTAPNYFAGNVGIGTTEPSTALQVNGDVTITDKIRHAGDTNTAIRFPASDTITFETSGAERVRIDSAGKLLMGEITPATATNHSICTPGRLQSEGTYSITTSNSANVVITSGGLLSRSTSSLKYKTDVEDAEIGYSEALIYGSRPVWYRSLSESDPSEYSYWGFIAEEVAEIDPRMVFLGPDGPEGVQYDRYVVHLVNVIQKQQQRLDTLEARIAALEA